MKLKEKMKEQYVYRKENGKWSFWDENNRPIGVDYENIEQAINALYQYLELEEEKNESNN